MKICTIGHIDTVLNRQTNLGMTQSCYFIQRALGWFGLRGLDRLNNLYIFTTRRPFDVQPACVAADTPGINYTVSMEFLPWLWGNFDDVDEATNRSKADDLACRIDELERECILVFGYFDLNPAGGSLLTFLKHWDIAIPQERPDPFTPYMTVIDTDAKTVRYETAPYFIHRLHSPKAGVEEGGSTEQSD